MKRLTGDAITFDVSKAAKSTTLTFRMIGLRKFRVRCWLTLRLLELLSLIAPFSVEIEDDEALNGE